MFATFWGFCFWIMVPSKVIQRICIYVLTSEGRRGDLLMPYCRNLVTYNSSGRSILYTSWDNTYPLQN